MKWRLVGAFVGVMVVVLVAVGVPLVQHLRDVEVDRLTAELQRDAFLLAGTAEDTLSTPDESRAAAEMSSLQSSVDVYASTDGALVEIIDATGLVAVSSDGAADAGTSLSTSTEVMSALAGVPFSGRDANVFVAVPVLSGASTVGAVRVAYPVAVIDDRANGKVGGLVLVGLISLLAAVIAALFMASTLVRPLRRLQRSTERVASGDFSSRADTDEGPPEVRNLALAFNAMTTRVAELVEQQRSFASDASHQLRTPLTALRLQLERASELSLRDPDAARERVDAASAETERLQRMVEGLLLLARTDRSATTVEIDLTAIAAERADIWRPLAGERDVQLETILPSRVLAVAVAGAAEQVIDNYIDNALDACSAGTTIEVVVGEDQGWAEVHVLDRGQGLTPEQLPHAFDRFWRAPDAEHDGSGLGLAIVHHLAAASGGQVSLSTRAGGGIDACLRLRVAPHET